MYGDPSVMNDSIGHIINQRHFDLITQVIETSGCTAILEGIRDREHIYIGPTLIEDPNLDS